MIEEYVRNCAWAKDAELAVDRSQILCESYRDKVGSQRYFQSNNPLQLVGGSDFFKKKKTLFNQVVGFAKFAEFLIVAEVSRVVLVVWLLANAFFSSSSYPRSVRLTCRYLWMDEHSPPDGSRLVCIPRRM